MDESGGIDWRAARLRYVPRSPISLATTHSEVCKTLPTSIAMSWTRWRAHFSINSLSRLKEATNSTPCRTAENYGCRIRIAIGSTQTWRLQPAPQWMLVSAFQMIGSEARDPHSIRTAQLALLNYATRMTFYATHMTTLYKKWLSKI